MLSELERRQEPRLREEPGPELTGVGDGARLLAVGRWLGGCCRRLLSWFLGSEWKRKKASKCSTNPPAPLVRHLLSLVSWVLLLLF